MNMVPFQQNGNVVLKKKKLCGIKYLFQTKQAANKKITGHCFPPQPIAFRVV